MAYVIEPPRPVVVPVLGDGLFPVRRVYCVGRNYAAHAREMGADPTREAPFFFCKPADAVVSVGPEGVLELPYPVATANLHYEAELVVAIGLGGADIPVDEALAHVWGYGVGLDMTRRDLQTALKDKGRPWELGKAFDRSAPLSTLVPAGAIGHPQRAAIWLERNGESRQRADIADMIWSVAEIVAHLSRYFRLEPGDLVFTGTPDGVGPVVAGDVVEAGVEGVGRLRVRYV
ncbi:MAG TPA: fumarylacetoacetate hydrolase family protein [Zoogloea sp.]|uniref:fumarylacetoacetate hydrolase family protein n=1 Tax=Zoogloea sp. TaxID=49181 RepID=UPI002D174A37|nr:fumarylacetoacetate hydrolase family protein [Zoogloea sp.]HMW52130.1 fumarylacetoacetate hydrolase family protein [Rhodocyclaceae bacterium]HMY48122.1 fumarylacetoacetate hydrolase family protein [Rhodocyclaceae bacterium]HNA67026.1 fumarylacetoacetate hydrolase family protein [Rhodocyclaceae bacterium]HNB63489.1 fumarylacetoacetate hydrolase family protein [Rhodocyclaceae bacterium]HNC77899.1 fumarylacetoacetate hydrolase family protein [Rhodocyclaceae bacterium]